MLPGTCSTGLRRAPALVARLLAFGFLLASLLLPPLAEGAPAEGPAAVAVSVTMANEGDPGILLPAHCMIHTGAHCACQVADRATFSHPIAPSTLAAVGHPVFTEHSYSSLETKPPARPPRA